MTKIKVRRIVHKIAENMSCIFGLGYIWAILLLLVCAGICLALSIHYNKYETQLTSSIFSNIFAGLLTGLVVLVISSIKNVRRYKTQQYLYGLEELHNRIEHFWKYQRNLYDTRLLNYIFYDTAYKAFNSAGDVIECVRNSDKIKQYRPNFNEYLESKDLFKVRDNSECWYKLRELLCIQGSQNTDRKQTINSLELIRNDIDKLNIFVIEQITMCKKQLNIIDKSII